MLMLTTRKKKNQENQVALKYSFASVDGADMWTINKSKAYKECTSYIDVVCTQTVAATATCLLPTSEEEKLQYLSEEMLDDCGQSFHPPVSLDQQPPQLADGLVPLLHLLFALTGFSRACSVHRHCCGWAALGCILQTGPRPGTGSWPSSRLGPGARASAGAGVGGCGVSRGRRWDQSLWCFSWCLWYLVRTSRPQV